MREFAQIIKGTVVNRAVFDDDVLPKDWPDADQWHEATGDMQVGAVFDGRTYARPVAKTQEDSLLPPPRDLAAEIDALKAKLAEQDTKLASLSETKTATRSIT